MGRFYKTSSPDFVESLIKKDAAAAAAKTEMPKISQLVEGEDYLPNDWQRVDQVTTDYDAKLNELTQRVYKDPTRSNDALLEAQKLAQKWSAENNTGELAALKQRKQWYDREVESIQEAFKEDPAYASKVIATIQVPDYTFDEKNRAVIAMPESRDYVDFTPEDYNKWLTTTRGALKEDLIRRGGLNNKGELEPGTSLWEKSNKVGLTEQKILETYVASVPENALRAEQLKAEVDGTGIDETQFYTRDANGNIVLNLDTKLGRQIQSEVTGLKYTKEDAKYFQASDPYVQADAREAAKAQHGAGSREEIQAGTDLYTKYNAHVSGNTTSYQDNVPLKSMPKELKEDAAAGKYKFSNFMGGKKVGNKTIVGVVKKPGEWPLVIYEGPNPKVKGLTEYTYAKLNSNVFQTTETQGTYIHFTKVAQDQGTYTDDGFYDIDETKDKDGPVKTDVGNTGQRGGGSSQYEGGSTSTTKSGQ